jgi:hypothetical protein
MTRATDERTAPDTASGAVLLHPPGGARGPVVVPVLTEREFWRAVAVAVRTPVRRRRR